MNQELTQNLYDAFPELFGDNPGVSVDGMPADPAIEFEVGDGWYTLIYTLCDAICADFKRAKKALDTNTDSDLHNMLATEQMRQFELLPSIRQIKEKFGCLCFYAGTFTPAHKHYIAIAERLSCFTCRGCGKARGISIGWVNNTCVECRVSSEETHFHG